MESISIVTSLISIYCALYFISQNTEVEDQTKLSEEMKVVLFLLILTSNMCFFTYWSACMFIELKAQLRTKFSKLYLILCLCGKVQKFEDEIKVQKEVEEHEILRERVLKSLKNVKDSYEQKAVILDKNKVERLEDYLTVIWQQIGVQETVQLDEKSKKRKERVKKGRNKVF